MFIVSLAIFKMELCCLQVRPLVKANCVLVLWSRCVAIRVCKGCYGSLFNNALIFIFFSAWRHWGCVTKKILENIKKSIEEASEVDGYEDLRPEDQAKVIKAWQEGHVADEDIPDSARKDEDAEEKPKKAKKAPAKKKADEDGGEASEKPKRGKTAAKVRSLFSNGFTLLLIIFIESCEG